MGRILIIGGNRFVGYQLVWRLVAAGEQVTTLNRGNISDPFTNRIERLHADRTSPAAFANAMRGRDFDAVVDFAAFNAVDTQGAVEVLQDRVGHYVFISSGSVYMVREGTQIPCSDPLPETAYAGDVSTAPSAPEDLPSWRYGTGKRAAEDVLAAAWAERRFPATCLRLPTVNGVCDPERRIESYLWRILDGGPVLLPDGGNNKTRHVYSGDVVKAIVNLLGRQRTFGDAFNLSQEEQPTLRELVRMLTEIVGAPNRSQSVASSTLEKAGLSSRTVSPFSGRWASCLDPTRAKEELGFRHEPLMQYLGKIVYLLLRLKEYHLGTYQHSIRVSQLCFQLAKDLGFSKDECQLAGSAGLYHDVGKLTIPLDILAKPGKLTKEEYTTIQGHVLSGVDLLKDRGVDSPVIEAVLHHHEREDGTGYPGGIRTISPLGRIIAICDVFDALTENREYRMGSTKETAVKQIITKQVGSFYMPYVHQFNLLIKNEIKSRKSINFALQMQEL